MLVSDGYYTGKYFYCQWMCRLYPVGNGGKRIDKARSGEYNNRNLERGHGYSGKSVRCPLIWRLVTSLRREVRLMGNGRGAKVLRFLLCFFIVFAVLMYIAPKVC